MKRIPSFVLLFSILVAVMVGCHRQPLAPPPPKDLSGDQRSLTTPPLPPPPASQPTDGSGGIGILGSAGVEGGVEGGIAGGILGGDFADTSPKEEKTAYGNVLASAKVASPSALERESADQLIVMEARRDEPKKKAGERDKEERGVAQVTSPPAATQGILRAQKITGEPLGDFPLQHTEVTATVGGYLARTTVAQIYANPYKEVIEAVYVFPLGGMAAVNDFVMEVGGRRIVGVVRPREEAEQIYREARQRGQTASLLTQERPNIFTQNVANIEPGGTVKVTLTTFERLRYEKGTYEYVFPMVVGPRYIPGGAAAPSSAPDKEVGGGGWSPATDIVPDAHRITPPVLKPGERSGTDIGITVSLDAGIPLGEVTSVAHKIHVRRDGATSAMVTLSKADGIPNRDFVLRWKVDATKMQFGVIPYRKGSDGYFTLMVQPPLKPSDAQVSPREITFILDVSGSMSGLPIETSKALVREVLDRFRPEDALNLFVFASGNGQLWESARPGTAANIAEAKRYLNSLSGGGGTEMLAGLKRAIQGQHDPKFLQMFVFCTDGFVGDEERILAFVQKERAQARFFAFGIGSSVNRYLIDGVGSLGAGKSMTVLPREEGQCRKAAERFFDCIDSPVLVDAAVDWNGLPVKDVYPSKLGDLFAGGTLDLVGRYDRPATGTAYVTGRVGAKIVRFPVKVVLPEKAIEHRELAPVWARYRIAELSDRMLNAGESVKMELVQTITDLAVKHRLMSQFTAFVAVDESRIVGDGRPLKVLQPVEIPEGVSYQGIFGEPGIGQVCQIRAWGLSLQQTKNGGPRVAQLTDGGSAEKAGVPAGASVKAVNGTAVFDMAHLEGLLLQSGGKSVRVTFEPGGERNLPTP